MAVLFGRGWTDRDGWRWAGRGPGGRVRAGGGAGWRLSGEDGPGVGGPQTLVWGGAVRLAGRGPAVGRPWRDLVLRSRCRLRSTTTASMASMLTLDRKVAPCCARAPITAAAKAAAVRVAVIARMAAE